MNLYSKVVVKIARVMIINMAVKVNIIKLMTTEMETPMMMEVTHQMKVFQIS